MRMSRDEYKEYLKTGKVPAVKKEKKKVYVFYVEPMGKPRMVRSDKWKKRAATERYWAYKDQLTAQALENGYEMNEDGILNITFFMPIPASTSKKKRAGMEGKPHHKRPDVDNMCKGWMDCMCKEDNFIWSITAKKVYSESPRIEIYEPD